ncbi:isoamylase early set domain-containing protein [Fibrivirga algicola]|uniref:Glycoside hydrolase n=1 Tax=Fibrivirga algicola TaxID=2950420 RepID=A0ABX0QML1_9BACT|nr:isoamylase early set domain-containing protein [Fibrivirga algicola]ARK11665.1 glycoside hydrolase [Fibrella sp. ES10-3-2-2]NID13736.1 glycoside hydrolase [Fibrivirga algicola]
MPIAKQFLKSKPVAKVTFELPAEAVTGAKVVSLVGDFNDWDVTAQPLKKQKDGSFKATVELPIGTEYQYRFIVDGETWVNDWAADKYVPSPVSTDENSVVVL